MASIAEILNETTDEIEQKDYGVSEWEVLSGSVQEKMQKDHRVYWKFKRGIDIIFSLGCLIMLSPLFLLLTILIFLDDPHGSPFFSQERVGRNGKIFKFYKFRSMVVGAEGMLKDLQNKNEKDGPVFKIVEDPRITRIGRFIRKTSLDELPQFLNVLKGDMTVVGPRPAIPREVAKYNDYQKIRLCVTPGLTCYWQVQPNRDQIKFNEWVDLDIQYIQDRNIWLDLKLIVKTVRVMFMGQGS